MKNIMWFKDITREDIDKAGGKGASLGEMFDLFPIPDGFVVTAQVFEKFFSKIKKEVFDILDIVDIDDTEKLEKASEEIKFIMLGCDVAKEIQKEIIDNYSNLRGFVAVRSSATAEDLPTASFAGQQESFLNVKGNQDVVTAVQKCWASLFTARAIYYREKNNFKHDEVLIAVVIQKMIDAKKAGVLFTVNPVTNHKDEIVIEASFGLGEAVVSGAVTPDYYLIDKKDLVIKDKNINAQEWGIFRNKKGENEKVSIKNPIEPVLSDKEAKELAKISKRIEEHYKYPQDIEWAIDDKIYILQSRPITTFK